MYIQTNFVKQMRLVSIPIHLVNIHLPFVLVCCVLKRYFKRIMLLSRKTFGVLKWLQAIPLIQNALFGENCCVTLEIKIPLPYNTTNKNWKIIKVYIELSFLILLILLLLVKESLGHPYPDLGSNSNLHKYSTLIHFFCPTQCSHAMSCQCMEVRIEVGTYDITT